MYVRRFLVGFGVIIASIKQENIHLNSFNIKQIPTRQFFQFPFIMVHLEDILAHNVTISSSFPPGLVALFVGATSGIGAATLKAFAKHTIRPRAYFVGRSQPAADLILTECKALNPEGEYIFIQADVSLVRVVDDVCSQIKTREKELNILFLSQGVPSLDRSVTSENIHLLSALCYYSRLRFTTQLLPLLQHASGLRRVITVAGGGFEASIDPSDFPALLVPLDQIRGHLSTLITLGLEGVARQAPTVTFIHDYPGTVNTPLTQRLLTTGDGPMRVVPADWMAPEESGERHVYLLSCERYPSAEDEGLGPCAAQVVSGTNGQLGSGVYSVGPDGESSSIEVLETLKTLRDDGMIERIWQHTQSVFERVVGNA
ncbi:hypothetical protein BJX76DRAFT_343832 [Aspergillus varians]